MILKIDYATPGPLTDLSTIEPEFLSGVGTEAESICRRARGLVVQPYESEASGISRDRFDEKNIRPASQIVRTLLELEKKPLDRQRDPENRIVGTCRHFAVLSCALLRYAGIPARARCGFATYFFAGRGVDH